MGSIFWNVRLGIRILYKVIYIVFKCFLPFGRNHINIFVFYFNDSKWTKHVWVHFSSLSVLLSHIPNQHFIPSHEVVLLPFFHFSLPYFLLTLCSVLFYNFHCLPPIAQPLRELLTCNHGFHLSMTDLSKTFTIIIHIFQDQVSVKKKKTQITNLIILWYLTWIPCFSPKH